MKWEQLIKFKTFFESQRRKIDHSQEWIKNNFYPIFERTIDLPDPIATEMDQSVCEKLKRREAATAAKIDDALYRISLGTFGACFICGEEISLLRLQMQPTITHCSQCGDTTRYSEVIPFEGIKPKNRTAKLRLT